MIEDFLLGLIVSWSMSMFIIINIDAIYLLRGKKSPLDNMNDEAITDRYEPCTCLCHKEKCKDLICTACDCYLLPQNCNWD